MANLLIAIEKADTCAIEFKGANTLAAVEAKDTALFYSGSRLSGVESADTASFGINTVSFPAVLSAVEKSDVGAIDILQGQVNELVAVESPDTALIHGYSGILLELAGREKPDRASIDVLQGFLAELVATESPDTASITLSAATHALLAGIEDTDYAFFDIRQTPVTYVRMAVVMHLFSHAVTEYKNFNFNSLAHFRGLFLGANESGITVLGGKDDLGVPIEAGIRTGIQDFASDGVIKYPKEAWIAYRTDGQLELDVEVEEGESYPYFFDKTSRHITETRGLLGKGLDERFYTFSLKNLSGTDFDLESLRILGDVSPKRRR